MLKRWLAPRSGDLITLGACCALLILVALPALDLLDRVDAEAGFKIFPRSPVAYSLLGVALSAFLVWVAFSASQIWKRAAAYSAFCGIGLALLLCQTRLVNQVPLGDWPESKLIAFAFERFDVSPAHLPSTDFGFVLAITFLMTVSFAIIPLIIIRSMLKIQLTLRDQPPRKEGRREMLVAIGIPLILAAAFARFGESWGGIDLISNLMWVPIASAGVAVFIGVPVIVLACCRSTVWRWVLFTFWMLPIAACNMLGYVITSLENGWNIDEVFWSALTASVVCFLGALSLLAIAEKAGFRLVAYRSSEMAGANQQPRDGSRERRGSLRFSLCSPAIVLLLFSAIAVWSSFLDSYHLRIFYLSQSGERFANARLAKLMTKQIELVEGRHRDIEYVDFRFNANGGLGAVQIQIGGDRSVEVLHRLQEVNVSHVELVGPGRNLANELRYPSFTSEHLAALAECKSVTSLRFSGLQFEDMHDSEIVQDAAWTKIRLDDVLHQQRFLRILEKSETLGELSAVHLDHTAYESIYRIPNLHSLDNYESQMPLGISQMKNLVNLSAQRCEFEDGFAEEVSDSKSIQHIYLSDINLSMETFFQLFERNRSPILTATCANQDSHFGINDGHPRVSVNSNGIDDELIIRLMLRKGDLSKAVEDVAEIIERDESGSIVNLKLRPIYLSPEGIEQLGVLEDLRSLGMRRIYWLSGEEELLISLASLKDLERLSLPIYTNLISGIDALARLERLKELEFNPSYLTTNQCKILSDLKQLERIRIPNHPISERFLAQLKTMDNLKEIIIFPAADPADANAESDYQSIELSVEELQSALPGKIVSAEEPDGE